MTKEVKNAWLKLAFVLSINPNTLPKNPLIRRSSRKWIFQEDEHTDLIVNDTISTLNYITIGPHNRVFF